MEKEPGPPGFRCLRFGQRPSKRRRDDATSTKNPDGQFETGLVALRVLGVHRVCTWSRYSRQSQALVSPRCCVFHPRARVAERVVSSCRRLVVLARRRRRDKRLSQNVASDGETPRSFNPRSSPAYLTTSAGTIGAPSHSQVPFGPRVSARDLLPGTAVFSSFGSHADNS